MKIIEFTDRKAGWKRYVKAKSKSDAIAHVLASDYLINAFPTNDMGGWIIPAYSIIAARTVIPACSVIGKSCQIGSGCEIGPGCELWPDCTLENGPVSQWMTAANIDGSGRQLLLILRPDGTQHVRAGCFFGTLDEFVSRASAKGKMKYALAVPAIFDAMGKMEKAK